MNRLIYVNLTREKIMSKKLIEQAIQAVLAIGLISVVGTVNAAEQTTTQQSSQMMGDIKGMEKCYGIAKAGMNDCSAVGNGCAGESKINNDKTTWIMVPEGTCKKIVGSSLKPASNT